ncbi:MAG: hypothetical protein HKO81_04395 [Flavobacteriaceae bacterium]|nr:hypothetical protein [Bacteroidia bacterium]NNL15865.1 hypothetical protein [Flavobacteriaceae bacterium]
MKKLLLFSLILVLLAGCSSKKQIEQQLHSGNYDQAITNALRQLQSKKTEKRKSKFISILKDGYDRITKRDLEDIAFLKKDGNPANNVKIFEMYSTLDARQRAIEPVLPLYLNGREVKFNFNDYTSEMIYYKNKTSEYLYGNALNLLKSDNKNDFRLAYDDLAYINSHNPNYKDVDDLMQEAYHKGIDYVIVSIKNDTQQAIPNRLEEDLLNFDTYGLNEFWTVYHANPNESFNYDYTMQLQLKQINISPEQVRETEFIREKEIKDGWEYQLDSNGNVEKDSLGNDIKIDKFINIRARFLESHQIKSTQILADVVYTDLITNQDLDRFTIDSGFVFENVFGTFRGDKRALLDEDRRIIRNRMVPFPSNEQMIYDTGEDLKLKLKEIINSYKF